MRLAIALTALFSMLATAAALGEPRAIYGRDDRRELDDPSNDARLHKVARATGLILSRSDVRPYATGTYRLNPTTLGERYNLCPGEAYADQPAPGLCSGFLIGSDLLVTAAHCVRSSTSCANLAVVFDFNAASSGGGDPEIVSTHSVYSCHALIERVLDHDTGVDFALIKLDRPVEGRRTLVYRREGRVDDGARLTVIGHPTGLPLKIAGGGHVRDNTPASYFVTDLDTFVGSSGAPVVNDATGLVEGFVARGDRDWSTTESGCRTYYRCAQDDCRGEDIVRMTAILDYLP